MDKEKKARLEAKGWKVGTAEELLGMTPEEAADVEIRHKLRERTGFAIHSVYRKCTKGRK
jgi:hypothetical protein